jgi:hypothetical protein
MTASSPRPAYQPDVPVANSRHRQQTAGRGRGSLDLIRFRVDDLVGDARFPACTRCGRAPARCRRQPASHPSWHCEFALPPRRSDCVNLHFHAHAVASGSSIDEVPVRVPGAHDGSLVHVDGLPQMSNIYCHPGRAGGSPADARVSRIRSWRKVRDCRDRASSTESARM